MSRGKVTEVFLIFLFPKLKSYKELNSAVALGELITVTVPDV